MYYGIIASVREIIKTKLSSRRSRRMKKLTQLHVDVSAYFFALTLAAVACFFVAALCYVEMCASRTLLSAGGRLCGLFNALIDFIEGYL